MSTVQNQKLVAAAIRRLDSIRKNEAFDPINPDSRPTVSQNEVINDFGRIRTQWIVAATQCLAEGTLVQTPSGPVPIQDIRPGDSVYSEHGLPIKVLQSFSNGEKEVVELLSNRKKLVECTDQHRWLAEMYSGKDVPLGSQNEVSTSNLSKYTKICRRYVSAPLGNVHVPQTYALGALLGDGCSREVTRIPLVLSSASEELVRKVANGYS